jgi:hypothetical protein
MSSNIISSARFQSEAIGVIVTEIEQMTHKNKDFIGVSFEGGRKEIWVYYKCHGCCMGQEQRYPIRLWEDICLAMRLVGRVGHRWGCRDLVGLSDAVHSSSSKWAIFPGSIGDNWSPTLLTFFQRVDEVMLLLDSSLATQQSQSHTCPTCDSPMIQADGGDDEHCSGGCSS